MAGLDLAGAAKGRTAMLAAGALVFNALIWGVSWWPFRQLQGYGLHPLWATALMYLLVVTSLLVVQFKAWRGFVACPQLLFLAVATGLTNIGFNWAVTVGDVVRVVLLFYLMPLWTVLLSRWLLNERISARGALRVAESFGVEAAVQRLEQEAQRLVALKPTAARVDASMPALYNGPANDA